MKKVTVYQIVNELEWVKYSLESAEKNAGMDFDFIGCGWNIPKETKNWLSEQDYLFYEYPDKKDFMKNLYHGWRRGFLAAETDIVVPIAGDMVFYRNWLKNLVKHAKPNNIVNCKLIERGALPSHHLCKDFGVPPNPTFDLTLFELFSKGIEVDSLKPIDLLLAAKPYVCFKDTYWKYGGEPSKVKDGLTGDQYFLKKAMADGIKLVQATNSIVYHWQRAKEKRFLV